MADEELKFATEIPPRTVRHRITLTDEQVEVAILNYLAVRGVRVPPGTISTYYPDKDSPLRYRVALTVERTEVGS